MKILQIISNGFVCGGAEQSVLTIKTNLAANGHEVKVLASDLQADDVTTFSDYTYPHIIPGRISGYFKRLWNPDSYNAIKKAIKDFRPDIVHFHTMGELSPSAIFAAGKTPAILTVHGPEEYTKGMLKWFLESNAYKGQDVSLRNLNTFGKAEYVFYRWVQRPLYLWGFGAKLSLIISPTANLAYELAHEKYGVEIRQLYNGLALPDYQKMPKSKTVTYVGRLSHVKGVSYLIEAWREIQKTNPDAKLCIVGEGPEKTRLIEQSSKLKNITFLGWQTNHQVMETFKNSRLVVMPSIWPENQPTVCIEAMAVGRPVVGTNVGGIPELINDGVNGFIVKTGSRHALATAINKLLKDEALAQKMSLAAASDSQKFRVGQFIHELEVIYKKVVLQK